MAEKNGPGSDYLSGSVTSISRSSIVEERRPWERKRKNLQTN
ncbi:MAG: hypothetical protein ACE14P_09410 [Methanotrichaceae archaeon]